MFGGSLNFIMRKIGCKKTVLFREAAADITFETPFRGNYLGYVYLHFIIDLPEDNPGYVSGSSCLRSLANRREFSTAIPM